MLLFNYISPKYPEHYQCAVKLLADKYPDIMKADNAHSRHVREFYLNDNPLKLGGRCCPLPGQRGSNNGGEKWGGLVKAQHRGITRWVTGEEKKNALYVMCAVAQHQVMSRPLHEFATQPVKDKHDYDLLRQLSKFKIDLPGNVCLDVLHMICTEPNDKTKVFDTSKIIGNPNISFVAHFPTATNVYSNMSKLSSMSVVTANAISFFETGTYNNALDRPDTVEKCHAVIGNMVEDQVLELKRMLYQNLLENTLHPKEGEDFDAYLIRIGQRNPAGLATTARTKARMKALKKRVSKKKRRTKDEKEKNLDKYGESEDVPLCNDVEVVSTSAQAKTDESGQDICTDHIYCGEDFDVGDLCSFLDAHHGIEVDNDNVLQMENDKEHLVKVKRQLGSWVEVHVDARRQRVTCTCEDYNADRYCPHCATFEVLQFGRLPTTKCCYAGERWNDVKKKCVDVLKRTYVDI